MVLTRLNSSPEVYQSMTVAHKVSTFFDLAHHLSRLGGYESPEDTVLVRGQNRCP